jgi:hypothetical protein
MKELSEIIQELVDSSNSMNQIDSKTAIRYVVEAYEAGMEGWLESFRQEFGKPFMYIE